MSYLHGLSQSSVSKAITDVTMALNHPSILRKHIHFPQTRQERQRIVNRFSNKFGFPGVLGCIDGTHVALVRPSEHEERFFNRKHYHSRNVQIICDSDLNILNIDATFGGATHDAYIWKNSEIHNHLQQLNQNGESIWFLGDSGYPLRTWLLTPILNTQPGSAEENYTNMHCRTRNTVERCIGVLKARWRCLLSHRVLHYNHHVVAKIVNACAVLHNITNKHRLPVPELPSNDIQREADFLVPRQPYIEEGQQLEGGRQQRQLIVQRLWRNR
ncbi:putative nuclease HARBI1 [Aricia agestis]|uniref:putative nuclease HARBI1 n=1 Tax=Aricia agestis TaxID=91739 RepID=UPI001C208402|nr:putative nuclease HARBI1 [Aricia agestis]